MSEVRVQLKEHYEIRSMAAADFDPLFQKHTQQFFDDETQVFRVRDSFSEEERAKLKTLAANLGTPFELHLGVFYKSEFVGWHYGRQDSISSFYMQNSGILPKHRGQGLYSAIVQHVVKMTTELGFQSIWSRHNATNNAVIVPKLKAGFLITALEVSDMFGTLVHLQYFPKDLRRKMMDYRVGQIKPDDEIKKSLKI